MKLYKEFQYINKIKFKIKKIIVKNTMAGFARRTCKNMKNKYIIKNNR